MSDQSGARRGEYQYRLSLLQLHSELLLSLYAFIPSEAVCCELRTSIILDILVRKWLSVCACVSLCDYLKNILCACSCVHA